MVDETRLFAFSMRSTVRAVLSLLPPGGFGTTSSTFFCGVQPCAPAVDVIAASAITHPHCFIAMLAPAVSKNRAVCCASLCRCGCRNGFMGTEDREHIVRIRDPRFEKHR